MRVYRPSDRIKVSIDGLTFTISPLSYHEKAEIQEKAIEAGSGNFKAGLDAGMLAIKYALKDVDGLENADGSKFQYTGSDEDIDVLFNMEQSDKLSFVCLNLIKGVPKTFIDPHDGKAIAGVKFVGDSSGKKK